MFAIENLVKKLDIVFLVFFILLALVLNHYNITGAAILLAFLPAICSTIYNNSEKLQLLFCKLRYWNKSVGLKLKVRKNFKDVVLYEEQESSLELKLKEKLKENGVTVGEENNKLRIERQKLEYNQNSVKVRMPFIIDIQIDNDKVICHIENYENPMKYSDISVWLNEAKYLWGFVEEQLASLISSEVDSSAYECKIELNKNLFKKVYLASFVDSSRIKELNFTNDGYKVLLREGKLEIRSGSKKSFIESVEKYAKFSNDFHRSDYN